MHVIFSKSLAKETHAYDRNLITKESQKYQTKHKMRVHKTHIMYTGNVEWADDNMVMRR